MSPNQRRPRKAAKSSALPHPTKSTSSSAVAVFSPNNTIINSSYDITSHSFQHASSQRQTTNFSNASINNNSIPHYTQATYTQETTNLTPMQRFEQPSPFPYHKYTTYNPPATLPSSDTYIPPTSDTGIYTNTYHASNSHHETSRDYSIQAEAGSYPESPYPQSQVQRQDVYSQTTQDIYPTPESPYYSTSTSYDGTWERDDLSGVGQQFGSSFEGYEQTKYRYGDVGDEL